MKGFCISLDVSKGSSFYQGFKGLDEPIEVEEQRLDPAARAGFTVVEWGGTEIK